MCVCVCVCVCRACRAWCALPYTCVLCCVVRVGVGVDPIAQDADSADVEAGVSVGNPGNDAPNSQQVRLVIVGLGCVPTCMSDTEWLKHARA